MGMTNAERRAQVLAKIEAKLREIWPDQGAGGRRTFKDFDELEAMAARTGDSLAQELLTAGLTEAMAERVPDRQAPCSDCGRRLQWKKVRRRVETIRGPVEFERDHGYCRACRRGFFPL